MEAVHVVGAGGIGCTIGFALRKAGCPVTMVERNRRKVEWGRAHGIVVDRLAAQTVDFVDFDDWKPPADSVVILCTKCYDNAQVLERLSSTVNLIPIQNGFDSALEKWDHDLEGIASFVSECSVDEAHTRFTRKGKLHIGRRIHSSKVNDSLWLLAASLRRAGLFQVVEVPVIEPYKYTKLMYNAAISPLAAAAGIDNGKLLSVPMARHLFFALLEENYRILAGAGIELGTIGPFHPGTVAGILRRRWLARLLAWAFEPSLRGTYCSMAPDLPKGRTEIDNYNQRLIDLAGNQPCPLNRSVVRLIKRMERERIKPDMSLLNEIDSSTSEFRTCPPAVSTIPQSVLPKP